MITQNRIVGIAGGQGSGKTTLLTALGYRAWKQGKKIYSTYHVDFTGEEPRDYYPIGCLGDIDNMKGGPHGAVWLADELYQWLFSRSSQSEINKQITMILMVARKRGISIYYTSHHPMHIDVMLRRITNRWIIPQMLPIITPNYGKIKQKATQLGIDPRVLYREKQDEIRQHPEYWTINFDVFNDIEQYIGTRKLKNLPFIFTMFDTTEEVNPLDPNGKPEYISEKGMELELHVENVASSVFKVERIPHSGRESDTHADFYLWPKCNPNIMYYVDACSVYKNRLIKTGLETKELLNEALNNKEYNTHAIIVFPYKNDLWYLEIKPDAYYLNYKSPITIWDPFIELIHPFNELLGEYKVNNSSGETRINQVDI